METTEEIKNLKHYEAYTDPQEQGNHNHLPEPVGEEKPYVLSLDDKCGRSHISLFGGQLDFHKYITTPIRGKNRDSEELFLHKDLADNQYEALWLRAKEKKIRWRQKNDKGQTELKSEYVAEYIKVEELPPGDYGEYISAKDLRRIAVKQSNNKLKKQLDEKDKEIAKLKRQLEDQRIKSQGDEDRERYGEKKPMIDEEEDLKEVEKAKQGMQAAIDEGLSFSKYMQKNNYYNKLRTYKDELRNYWESLIPE